MTLSNHGLDAAGTKLLYEVSDRSKSPTMRKPGFKAVIKKLQEKMKNLQGQLADANDQNDALRATLAHQRELRRPFINNQWAEHHATHLQGSLDSMTSAYNNEGT
jgi:hypothetical protein